MTTQPRYYAAARGSYAGEVANAVRDFATSFGQTPLWASLAWNDILQRYRGSLLGPFWIVLTNAAFAIGVGLVYSQIMRVPASTYLPWIATGVVIWNLFSTTVQEGGDAFVSQGTIIRQSSTPLPVFVWRTILRNLISFAHQLLVVLGVAIYFGYVMTINLPMAAVGVFLVTLNITWIVLAMSIICARFRDVQQASISILQLAFFLSPVIWIPSETRAVTKILQLNPIYHMLEVGRNPLLGDAVPMSSLVYLVVMALVGWAFAFLLYAGVRRRVVHYL